MKRAEWISAVATEYARCAVEAAFKGARAKQVERHLSRDQLAAIVCTTVQDALTRTMASTDQSLGKPAARALQFLAANYSDADMPDILPPLRDACAQVQQ